MEPSRPEGSGQDSMLEEEQGATEITIATSVEPVRESYLLKEIEMEDGWKTLWESVTALRRGKERRTGRSTCTVKLCPAETLVPSAGAPMAMLCAAATAARPRETSAVKNFISSISG